MKVITLKTTTEFSRVYKKGKSYADKHLVLYVIKNDLPASRIGISISKKVGNSVTRNRIRRLVKEVFRLNCEFTQSYDLIFIVRVKASEIEYSEVKKSMLYLVRKAGLH